VLQKMLVRISFSVYINTAGSNCYKIEILTGFK